LLAGGYRDPMVGRDILIGAAITTDFSARYATNFRLALGLCAALVGYGFYHVAEWAETVWGSSIRGVISLCSWLFALCSSLFASSIYDLRFTIHDFPRVVSLPFALHSSILRFTIHNSRFPPHLGVLSHHHRLHRLVRHEFPVGPRPLRGAGGLWLLHLAGWAEAFWRSSIRGVISLCSWLFALSSLLFASSIYD
jgi:hypothetical protein